eukprot:CAMPEP_0197450396 /NCGR_PEP_ID=MMETSP1175-20131217/25211_1 /TAXON_ID=1003142 /ORGANISM="Triceratium dubium, Strain CCMP147" /LENGTH=142 /DNA_ID=CAMNT_0042982809 /DNA_START=149 /DNA_END=573 /DNA_ORIENTATION=+
MCKTTGRTSKRPYHVLVSTDESEMDPSAVTKEEVDQNSGDTATRYLRFKYDHAEKCHRDSPDKLFFCDESFMRGAECDEIQTPQTGGLKRHHSGGITNTFPVKLHEMLEKAENDGYSHVVSWCAQGNAFVIYKIREFAEVVL